MNDWHEGKTLESAHVAPKIIEWIKSQTTPIPAKRNELPVTMKTRTGLDHAVTEFWISHLLEVQPEAITLLEEPCYRCIRGLPTGKREEKHQNWWKQTRYEYFLGNGDIKSMEQAKEQIKNITWMVPLWVEAHLVIPGFSPGKIASQKKGFDANFERTLCTSKPISS